MAFIGFGEAAQAFAGDVAWRAPARAFDIKTTQAAHRAAKLADYAGLHVGAAETPAEALAGASAALCLVTANEALAAAGAAADAIDAGCLFFDMNSVSPGTKRTACGLIERAGGRYVDAAIMAPVHPLRLAAPILAAGPHAHDGTAMLKACGFTNVKHAGDAVGNAAAIKMIRSVVVKGIEALTAECMLAAHAAGVTDEVLASLGSEWRDKADYNLDRMLRHGLRRAAEMEEAALTLEELNVAAPMTRGTALRQRAVGALGVSAPPIELAAKIACIARTGKDGAA